ncbi:unnamed protein product [Hymenolepis diminuta]|uniref:Reverse transcriptase domain-containing protein n=1 Tax=Hymenolepis diminuta TaxID=6216 RepID=A0A0R3STL5_HYMDI|nr:unnamed protein product [Hymenolepis diminuta]
MFRISGVFYVTTEIKGMMGLLGCPRMARESATLKVEALLTWRSASRDDEEYTTRTATFRDMVSLLRIQDTPDLITDLFAEDIDIPVEWRFVQMPPQIVLKAMTPLTASQMMKTLNCGRAQKIQRSTCVLTTGSVNAPE